MPKLATVVQLVSSASMEIGIAQSPVSQVSGSGDEGIVQMGALLSAVADELLMEEPYRTTLGDGNWAADPATGEVKPYPTTDTDLVLFDPRLAIDGLKFRFLAAKGLEFGEAMRDFTTRLNKLAGRANGRVLDLDVEGGRSV